MALEFLPFALHDIGEEEIQEVVDTLRSNWITTGPKVALFEEAFGKQVGSTYALAVNSGTAGLHLALEAVGVRPDDLVITTPYTFTATAEVIRYLGADPVFVDIRPDTYLIDPNKLREFCAQQCEMREGALAHRKDGRRVSAIIPVHIAGLSCDMDAICSIAKEYNLKVVEDAAHSFPAHYKGRQIGTIGDATVFSFYATKTITTGEGGMVTTDSEEIARRIRTMRLHGINRDVWTRYQSRGPNWYYEVVEPGFKYNMTDIQASIGIHQLRKAFAFLEKRRVIAQRYTGALAGLSGIELPKGTEGNGHALHLYIVQVCSSKIGRDSFIQRLAEKGIGTSVHFIPLHIQPYYRERYGFQPETFPNAYRVYLQAVSLPIYTKMTDGDTERVIQAVRDTLSEAGG
jgi:dTDP-4-amino-4,6-dideoxygalactose transaminase